jgi:protein-disulfide isomerase
MLHFNFLPTVLALASFWLAGCAATANDVATASDAPPREPAAPASPQDSHDVRTLGANNAPVTIIEFTDLQCPYCAQFALDTWPLLRARYVDTGKVQFVSRDLPLSFHPYAVPAAVASRCAGRQGKFWEYREALFRGQAHLAQAPYDDIAGRLGLDVQRFATCRRDPAVAAEVRGDAAVAAQNGIVSTPTFVIGRLVRGEFTGEVLPGAQPFESLAARIDALLADPAQP